MADEDRKEGVEGSPPPGRRASDHVLVETVADLRRAVFGYDGLPDSGLLAKVAKVHSRVEAIDDKQDKLRVDVVREVNNLDRANQSRHTRLLIALLLATLAIVGTLGGVILANPPH